MADPATEKALVERSDYEGLQLDTRARDETEKDLAATQNAQSPQSLEQQQTPEWQDEKAILSERDARQTREAVVAIRSSHTSSPSTSTPGAPILSQPEFHEPTTPAPRPRGQRICGLRRRWFWLIFVIVLVIIIVAAIVGGVVGGRMSASSAATTTTSPNSSSTSTTGPTISPGASNPFLPESDVMVDSPLSIVSFASDVSNNSTGGQSATNGPALRLYFQSAHGNVKESVYNGVLAPWQAAHPIFTDAVNNTGLAVVNYMNFTANKRQSTIFYVDSNLLLQEKRDYPDVQFWEPGTIQVLGQRAVGNLSLPFTSRQQDPENRWDSYRMAAVYSTKFHNGPGTRFFYHAQSDSGATWVQEMIWNQNTDSWSQGAQLHDPWPNSHLAATIDESTMSLRLFYSAGNLTLQESYINITQPDAQYNKGLSVPNLLAHNSADLAVVSTTNQTFLYYYASTGVLSIRELVLPSTSTYYSQSTTASTFAPDPAKLSIVCQPALVTNTSQISLYQPLGAVISQSTGDGSSADVIHVFWAEGVVDAGSGYSALRTVSRNLNSPWGSSSYGAAAGQVGIPLGDVNADPWPYPT